MTQKLDIRSALKSTNLISLANALTSEVSGEYTDYIGATPKDVERDSILKLCNALSALEISSSKLSHFFFGYNIPQIGKEFDLLRIGNNYNLNIEIKSASTEEKILKQLQSNKRYLSSLTSPIQLYCYLAETDTFYSLGDDDDLLEIEPNAVKTSILEQSVINIDDLDTLFDPSKYLVSPFNATDDFISNHYLLSPQQSNIERELDSIFTNSTGNVISIEGDAGTGKSLLLYDYAKKMIMREERPLIVHVAKLNQGHRDLMVEHHFSICEIKDFMEILDNLNNFDTILIDEAQRLRTYQLNKIMEYVKSHKINCVCGYDEKQKLSQQEYTNGAVDIIRSNSTQTFTLSRTIRTNKQLSRFIKSMFNKNYGKVGNIPNVSLVYFNAINRESFEYLINNQIFKFIRYTPSRFSTIDNRLLSFETPHEVIGQEFDNVVVYMGQNFFYGADGTLQAKNLDGNPYDFLGMLYQAVTRARKRLEIVIINNPQVFRTLSDILS